jgi:adenine-specific DNA methylase
MAMVAPQPRPCRRPEHHDWRELTSTVVRFRSRYIRQRMEWCVHCRHTRGDVQLLSVVCDRCGGPLNWELVDPAYMGSREQERVCLHCGHTPDRELEQRSLVKLVNRCRAELHELAGENLLVDSRGRRRCPACKRSYNQRQRGGLALVEEE